MMTRSNGLLDNILWGTLYSCTSFFFFTSLSTFIDSCLVPQHLRSSQKKCWKWVNYAVSWVHSTLAGSIGLTALILTPSLFENLVIQYSELAYISACISYGYFFYDFLDLIHNHDMDKGNHELVIHHLFALTSASLVVFTKTYVGYAAVALLIELHSSALHSRVLYKMYNSNSGYDTILYTLIKLFNMLFFFTFRFSALVYLMYGLFRDYYSAPNLGIYVFLYLSVGIILFLSITLFMRVVRSDFAREAPQRDKTFQVIKEGLVSETKHVGGDVDDMESSGDHCKPKLTSS